MFEAWIKFFASDLDINARDNFGFTPLMHAAQKGKTGNVFCLLKNGAKNEGNGKTMPIHLASQHGHRIIVESLLFYKSSLEDKDFLGFTPLHWAAKGGHLETVEFLVHKGSNTNSTVKYNIGKVNDVQRFEDFSPLELARHFNQIGVVKFLEQYNVDQDANQKDKKGIVEIQAQNILEKFFAVYGLVVTGIKKNENHSIYQLKSKGELKASDLEEIKQLLVLNEIEIEDKISARNQRICWYNISINSDSIQKITLDKIKQVKNSHQERFEEQKNKMSDFPVIQPAQLGMSEFLERQKEEENLKKLAEKNRQQLAAQEIALGNYKASKTSKTNNIFNFASRKYKKNKPQEKEELRNDQNAVAQYQITAQVQAALSPKLISESEKLEIPYKKQNADLEQKVTIPPSSDKIHKSKEVKLSLSQFWARTERQTDSLEAINKDSENLNFLLEGFSNFEKDRNYPKLLKLINCLNSLSTECQSFLTSENVSAGNVFIEFLNFSDKNPKTADIEKQYDNIKKNGASLVKDIKFAIQIYAESEKNEAIESKGKFL